MAGFTKLDETELLATPLITVATGRFATPDGAVVERTLVHHPGAVGVVPLLPGGRVLLVRQYRAAADAELLEIPAGKRDVAGEPPEVTAGRELAEEVGRRAGRLELLANFYTSVGFCDEYFHLYLATDLTEVPLDLQGEEEAHSSIHEVALADVPGMIARCELVDAKTLIGLSLVAARPD